MISIITIQRTENIFNFSSNLPRSEQWAYWFSYFIFMLPDFWFQSTVAMFLHVLLQLFIKWYGITPCRIWLSSGLYCFLLGWRTPFLEGNPRRRFPKQKPTNSRNLRSHFARRFPGCSMFRIPIPRFPRNYLECLSGTAQISHPTSIVGVALVSWITHNLCMHIFFYCLTLWTIFQLLNLSIERG